jgi:SEC-C motif domain protein
MDHCPCQAPDRLALSYIQCCGRFHAGDLYLQAPTALALMRSRYSAFSLRKTAYLLATWHPSTRPLDLEPCCCPPSMRWLGLEIVRHQVLSETQALVEFVARNKLAGRAQRMRETSRFVYEHRQWFYVDGDTIA